MDWAKLLSGLVSLVNRILQTNRDNAIRKDGVREAEVAKRDKLDEIRKEADKARRQPGARAKPDILKRL